MSDTEKLLKELKKHQDSKHALATACDEISRELTDLKVNIHALESDEYESIWKEKYDHQVKINVDLRKQLAKFTEQLQELKQKVNSDKKLQMGDDLFLSQLEWQRKLEQLKKRKTALQWALTDCEWRLDKEGLILDQNEEGLKELQTRLNETTSKIIDCHHKNKLLPPLTKTTPATDN